MTHRFSCVLALGVLFGCDQNKTDQTHTTGATEPTPQAQQQNPQPYLQPNTGAADPNDKLIEQMTDARCVRARACSDVGAGKKWNDDNACRNDLRGSLRSDFQKNDCKTIQNDKVQSCLDAIRDQRCDNVSDSITKLDACKKSDLCKD